MILRVKHLTSDLLAEQSDFSNRKQLLQMKRRWVLNMFFMPTYVLETT